MAIADSSALRNKREETLEIHNNKSYLIFKRLIDILGALLGLIILSPVFIIVACMINIEDPNGKIFFKQSRLGLNERPFNMYKFRSMVSNAEELLDSLIDKNETTGAMFKMKKDPRVTRTGRIIRKTSIDELPQLWNVLKGDMSLVGPRPPLPREVKSYTIYHKQRLLVKPGCTGLWQVSGRSNIGFEEMVELDLIYISNRSVLKDIKLILKTALMLLGSKGAF